MAEWEVSFVSSFKFTRQTTITQQRVPCPTHKHDRKIHPWHIWRWAAWRSEGSWMEGRAETVDTDAAPPPESPASWGAVEKPGTGLALQPEAWEGQEQRPPQRTCLPLSLPIVAAPSRQGWEALLTAWGLYWKRGEPQDGEAAPQPPTRDRARRRKLKCLKPYTV